MPMFYYYLPAVSDRCCKTWFDMMLAVVSASSSKSGPSANRVFMSYRQIGSLPRVEVAVVQVLQAVLLCRCEVSK